jgi:hypothetical protein
LKNRVSLNFLNFVTLDAAVPERVRAASRVTKGLAGRAGTWRWSGDRSVADGRIDQLGAQEAGCRTALSVTPDLIRGLPAFHAPQEKADPGSRPGCRREERVKISLARSRRADGIYSRDGLATVALLGAEGT